MKLTAEQTEDLPFPIGCLVWYNFPEVSSDEALILKQGVVDSVTFNYGTKILSYEVVFADNCHPKGIIAEEVPEHNLAYGAKCPVTIDSKEEGIVLLPERSPSHSGEFLYTVMIFMDGSQARYEVGVDARRIKYRKVAKEVSVHDDAAAVAGALTEEQSLEKSGHPPIANTPSSASVVPAGEVSVPSSIACESLTKNSTDEGGTDVKRKRDHRDIESPLTITPMKSHRVEIARSIDDSLYKQDSRRSINSGSQDSATINSGDSNNLEIVMTLPEWIGRDHQSQQKLFFYLIGSKLDKEKKRTVADVHRETNCNISVKCPEIGSPRDKQFPITIIIKPRTSFHVQASCTLSESEIHELIREWIDCKRGRDFNSADRISRDLRMAGVVIGDGKYKLMADGEEMGPRRWYLPRLDEAREKLQELLMHYLDFIDDSAAKGRLTYEVASSCTGPHRPKESTSNAVGWRGPNGPCFLSLVELPFVFHDGIRSYHAHMILQTQKNQHMKRLGCLIKIYGDDFGVPLKYCDPYALVSGGSWQNVDEAVEIVRDALKTHMSICSCTYSLQPPSLLPPPPSPRPQATAIHMRLPVWIQSDSRSQKDLFSHLIGSKLAQPNQDPARKRNLVDIGRESGCAISIHGFNKRSVSQTPHDLISINIRSKSSNTQDVDDACKKVTNHLLNYMDLIGDSGAKGRLTYEVASSYTGRHSTNNVVACPFVGYLALVELPFVLHDGRKSFHTHMITQTLENSQCVKRLECLIKVYGDDFGVPLKYCDPYALVSGNSCQHVDEVVEIVRKAIKTHMSTCTCAF